MAELETVKVKHPGGYCWVNISDLTDDHELYEDEPEAPAKPETKAPAPKVKRKR